MSDNHQQIIMQMAIDGNAEAQSKLGDIYYNRRNYREAIRWFTLSANQGMVYAQYSLGHMYLEEGPFENQTEGLKWLHLAANSGHAESQYRLALMYSTGRRVTRDRHEAARLCRLAANQDHEKAIEFVQGMEAEAESPASSCIIATACFGKNAPEVAALRKLRDDAILSDPLIRDFFHVFWSRYYEWSPGVARIAEQDRSVAKHIQWSFLEPWLAWMEIVAFIGQRDIAKLTETEKQAILGRLGNRLNSWLAQLPTLMEEKSPKDPSQLFEAFERFRTLASKVFTN